MSAQLKRSKDMAWNSMGQNKTPWHGKGIPMEGKFSVAELKEKIPHIMAPVTKEPVMRDGNHVLDKYFTVQSYEGEDQVLGVVGGRYQVVQNAEAFAFMDDLMQDPNGPNYETAGILYGGRVFWALAVLPDFVEIRDGDYLRNYILISNSHDGSKAVQVCQTPVRVVCANTLAAAENVKGKSIKFRHSGSVMTKIEDASEALGLLRNNFVKISEVYSRMAEVEPTNDQVEEVLKTLFPETKTARADLQKARVRELAEVGAGNGGGTAWDLYNGYTELEDHKQSRSTSPTAQDSHLKNMWWGAKADRKKDALEVIKNICL